MSPVFAARRRAEEFDALVEARTAGRPVDDARFDDLLDVVGALRSTPQPQARPEFVADLRDVSHAPVVYAELRGAQHAFDIFLSPRTAPVIEGVERFLWAVHRDWAAGHGDAGEGIVDDGTVVSEPDGEADVAEAAPADDASGRDRSVSTGPR